LQETRPAISEKARLVLSDYPKYYGIRVSAGTPLSPREEILQRSFIPSIAARVAVASALWAVSCATCRSKNLHVPRQSLTSALKGL